MHKSMWTSSSSQRSLVKLQNVLIIVLLVTFCQRVNSLSLSPVQENNQVIGQHRIIINNSAIITLYTFPETFYNIIEGEVAEVKWDYDLQILSPSSPSSSNSLRLNFTISDEAVASMVGNSTSHLINAGMFASEAGIADTNATVNATVHKLRYSLFLTGKFLGRANILVKVSGDAGIKDDDDDNGFKYRVSVIRRPRLVDMIFRFIIWLFVIFANTGMGCEIEWHVVKEVLRRPFAPTVGFVSQYLFMPMLAFGILQIISLPGSTALGYFGMGCAPGGGASNFYCLLLAGDVSLSITMTLISTLGAFGMTPLYMFTLGQLILQQRDVQIKIPYWNIVITLLLILIPSALGYLLKLKLPKVAKVYRKILKPIILMFVIFMFTFGVYANLFIWRLFSPAMILAGCALPYAGFIMGGLLALICQQSWARVKTISLETGIQNPGVPILILQTSLPQPDADLSLVGPVAAATFTPFPLFVWVAIRMIYYKCYLKQSPFQHRKNAKDDDRDDAAADDDDDFAGRQKNQIQLHKQEAAAFIPDK